jgi:hypothetical protein
VALNGTSSRDFDYAPDPHGGALFSALARWTAGSINGQRPISDRAATWYGPVATTQQFRGAAGLAVASRGSVYTQRSGVINDQVSTQDSSVSDAFLARMKRGQS